MQITQQQARAYVGAVKAVADAIKELGRVPSGHLYARIMDMLSVQEYEQIIGTLKRAGLIEERNFELIWIDQI